MTLTLCMNPSVRGHLRVVWRSVDCKSESKQTKTQGSERGGGGGAVGGEIIWAQGAWGRGCAVVSHVHVRFTSFCACMLVNAGTHIDKDRVFTAEAL